MFFLKFGVLAVMVLTLAALASNVLKDVARDTGLWHPLSVQVLPVLGGLFVAPWVTMICRSSLAGIFATTTFASLTFIVQLVIVGAWFGIVFAAVGCGVGLAFLRIGARMWRGPGAG